MAIELGSRNIRSNAIAPGFIVTEMTEKLGEETIKKYYLTGLEMSKSLPS